MIKNTKRALRRHHNARLLARTIRIERYWQGAGPNDPSVEQAARRRRDNRKKCSCFNCSNPRRHLGDLTLQELRANEARLRCDPDEP